jgi:hypothetical protein
VSRDQISVRMGVEFSQPVFPHAANAKLPIRNSAMVITEVALDVSLTALPPEHGYLGRDFVLACSHDSPDPQLIS